MSKTFSNTRSVIDDIVRELKNLFFFIVALVQLIYIGYLVYAIVAGAGILLSNIILLCIFVCGFGFFILSCWKKEVDLSHLGIFKYIKTRLKTTIYEFKRIYYYLSIFLQLLFISFAITSIVNCKGILMVNVLLIVISSLYLPILFLTYWKNDRAAKEFRKNIKRACSVSRIFVNGINIGFAVYGIFITSGNVRFADAAILTLMILGWVLAVLLQLITYYTEIKKRLIVEAFKQDTIGAAVDFVESKVKLVVRSGEKILSGVRRVKSFFKSRFFKGEDSEPDSEEKFVHK